MTFFFFFLEITSEFGVVSKEVNICLAHPQVSVGVAKNFGACTEKVGHPCPTFMAHPTRVDRRVGALHKKLGHPCCIVLLYEF